MNEKKIEDLYKVLFKSDHNLSKQKNLKYYEL